MFMVLYSLLLAIGLVVSAPWWLWRMATSGRYREGLLERLGFVPAALRAAVAGKKTVWVHAVSVGEVLAAERLISELKASLGDGWVVAVSTTTATGQKIARERLVGSPVFFYPLDFAFAVRGWLRVLRPSLFVLVESEFWPRMLVECERAGVPVTVVNARVSDRSFPRYMRLRRLWRPLLGKVSLFLAQGEESAERLRAIGAPVERVRVSGNLKYDLKAVQPNAIALRIKELFSGRKIVVAGSTVANEEQSIFTAWAEVLASEPEAALVLAPRHPQRFREVEELHWKEAFQFQFMTATSDEFRIDWPVEGGCVILLDTIGDLAAVYELASVAFVGGSLVAKGGHNPLEAARFGVPVVMGSSYENFREIVEGMQTMTAIRIVEPNELATGLVNAMQDDGGMGARGRQFFDRQSGATRKTVEALVDLIGGRV